MGACLNNTEQDEMQVHLNRSALRALEKIEAQHMAVELPPLDQYIIESSRAQVVQRALEIYASRIKKVAETSLPRNQK